MSLSEIQIVSKDNTTDGETIPEQQQQQPVIVDVFGASAYGDLPKLRNLVEQENVSLSKPDGNGYYPLQWASLNNFDHVVHYIIQVLYLFLIWV